MAGLPWRGSPLSGGFAFSNVCSMIDGMADDVVSALRDRYRCPAISRRDGRACQLQTSHDGAHAHVWRDTPKNSRRGRALPPMQLVRWDEEREWAEPWSDGAASHGEPLRWQTFLMP
jgi:hypothetical protein